LYNYDTDSFISNLSVTITDNELTAILPTLANGNYYFTFKVINLFNEVLEVTDKDVWKFSIADGEYESTEYDNTQYLIN
jgi:hypothetical protein